MSTYPLEWGWHTRAQSNTSSASDWKPKPTLLGGANPDDNIKLAAAGDLKCQSVCASGGSYGTTGAYNVEDKIMCRSCAVKALKIENFPSNLQNKFLRPYELQ